MFHTKIFNQILFTKINVLEIKPRFIFADLNLRMMDSYSLLTKNDIICMIQIFKLLITNDENSKEANYAKFHVIVVEEDISEMSSK